MPKDVLKLDRFEGGISNHSNQRDIADNEFAEATDATIHHVGRVKPIGSSKFYDTTSGSDGTVEPGYGLKVFQSDATHNPSSGGAYTVDTITQGTDGEYAWGRVAPWWPGFSDGNPNWAPGDMTFYITVNGVNESGTITVNAEDWNYVVSQRIVDGFTANSPNYDAENYGDGVTVKLYNKVVGSAPNGHVVAIVVTLGDADHVEYWYLDDIADGVDAAAHSVSVKVDTYQDGTWNLSLTEYDETVHTSSFVASGVDADAVIDAWKTDITVAGISELDGGDILTFTADNAGVAYEFNLHANVGESAMTLLGEEWIVIADETTSSFNAYATTAQTWIHSICDLGAGFNTKPAFMAPNGYLRISDGNYVNTATDKWWGYINRTHFDSENVDSLNQWASEDREIKTPTWNQANNVNTVAAGDSTAIGGTSPVAGRIAVLIDGIGSAGTWDAAKYRWYISSIYDGNQESKLSGLDKTTNHTELAAGESFYVSVYVNGPIANKRMTGLRVYYRKYETGTANLEDTDFHLFCEIDFDETRGVRYANQEDWVTWVDHGGGGVYSRAGDNTYLASEPFVLPTWTTINGREPDEDIYCRFVSADIANRRSYIARPMYGTTIYGDRVIESPVDEYDVHPANNYIDAAINDGESIVAISIFANKLLEFKQNTLYVIDIGGQQYRQLGKYSFKGVSIPGAIIKTDFGIAWVNEYGCYLYSGEGQVEQPAILHLLEKQGRKLIAPTTWAAFITATSTIGYNPKDKQLFVKRTGSSTTTSGDYYMFDFTTWSWTYGEERLGHYVTCTNFDVLSDGKMIFGVQGSGSGFNDGSVPNTGGGGVPT